MPKDGTLFHRLSFAVGGTMFAGMARRRIMEDLLALAILVSFLLLLLLEAVWPGRRQPLVRGWRIVGVLSFVAFFAVSVYAPLLWGDLLARHTLIDASGLGTLGGAILGLLVLDLATFGWHFALHQSSFLWRWFHQVHHSAERVDAAGAFYFSPLDMLGFTFAGSFALVYAFGVTPEAAMIANTIATFLAMFQHTNVKTPVWLGYVIQRPEQHGLHHGRGVHGFNYGNLSLWDQIFGTWRNPAEYVGEHGLFDGSTYRLPEMLRGVDIDAEHSREVAAEHAFVELIARPTVPTVPHVVSGSR